MGLLLQHSSTLGSRIVIQMAVRIAVVIVLITGLSYWHVYRSTTASSLDTLEKYVRERGERESQLFLQAEDNLKVLTRTFAEQTQVPASVLGGRSRFDRLFVRFPDGAWRRRSGFDVTKEASAFIASRVRVDAAARQRMLLILTLVHNYGRAWSNSVTSTFLATLDGMAATYWPGMDWYRNIAADARFADYPWVVNANPRHNPERKPAWTGIWYDWVARGWFVTCIQPVDEGGEFRYYAGTSLALEKILQRTQERHLSGTENLLFRGDGQLISHPRPGDMAALQADSGNSDISQAGDAHQQAIFAAINKEPGRAVVELERYGEYLGVTRIDGPGWYFVTILPKALIASSAFATAKVILWLGLLSLVVEIGIVGWIIRRQISKPLQDVVARVAAFGSGDLGVRAAATSDDELGRLAATFNSMAETILVDRKALSGYAESLEQLVQERTQQLEAKERAKTRFLASASHDLRQPIHAISLFLDTLRRHSLDARAQHIVKQIGTAAQSLKELLDSLLDVSKLDAGAVRPNLQVVPVISLFERLDGEFACLALAKKLRFKFFFPNADVCIRSDPHLVEVVLRNLVANALAFTQRGGVLVGTRRRGDRLLIQVWDTGCGIAAENLERVFDEFYQIENPHRDRSKGLGLGLAIARRVAALLDTSLACRSRPGRGTLFELALPICPCAALAEAGEGVAAEARDLRGMTLVVIEDDALVAQATAGWLHSQGARVEVFASAEAALAAPELLAADAYISDFGLPGPVDGLALLERIQAEVGHSIRGVLITGETSPNFIDAAARRGWQVLFKPVEPAQLLGALGLG